MSNAKTERLKDERRVSTRGYATRVKQHLRVVEGMREKIAMSLGHGRVNSTPGGFDPFWVEAVNGALQDRGGLTRINDLTEKMWDEHIGPMLDYIESIR
jgi:hypothetical protein